MHPAGPFYHNVHKENMPVSDLKTDMATLAAADWDNLEREVVIRIRLLKAMAQNLSPNDPLAEHHDGVANDLILPNIRLLAAFCASITIGEEEESDDDA